MFSFFTASAADRLIKTTRKIESCSGKIHNEASIRTLEGILEDLEEFSEKISGALEKIQPGDLRSQEIAAQAIATLNELLARAQATLASKHH